METIRFNYDDKVKAINKCIELYNVVLNMDPTKINGLAIADAISLINNLKPGETALFAIEVKFKTTGLVVEYEIYIELPNQVTELVEDDIDAF